MPYIKKKRRPFVRPETEDPITEAGELNFAITELCLDFLSKKEGGPRYADYNTVVGALECCKLEFYRRAIAPYEDANVAENGDVF